MSEKTLAAALVWLRRDLRVRDNAALHHALHAARRVWCTFVFDRTILDALPRVDRRVEFIRDTLVDAGPTTSTSWRRHAGAAGTRLMVCHGEPVQQIVQLALRLGVQAVYASHDDDPYALQRDARARGALAEHGVALHTSKDHVVFERDEVLSAARTPYSVFTPYKDAWLRQLDDACAGRACRWPSWPTRWRRRRTARRVGVPIAAGDRLRAQQPACAAPGLRRARGAAYVGAVRRSHRRLRAGTRLSGRQRAQLPGRAPALRHVVRAPARARGLAAYARRLASAPRPGCRS